MFVAVSLVAATSVSSAAATGQPSRRPLYGAVSVNPQGRVCLDEVNDRTEYDRAEQHKEQQQEQRILRLRAELENFGPAWSMCIESNPDWQRLTATTQRKPMSLFCGRLFPHGWLRGVGCPHHDTTQHLDALRRLAELEHTENTSEPQHTYNGCAATVRVAGERDVELPTHSGTSSIFWFGGLRHDISQYFFQDTGPVHGYAKGSYHLGLG